jgi:TetR/AcrR family fatty acid metabolism transcriptional regulator
MSNHSVRAPQRSPRRAAPAGGRGGAKRKASPGGGAAAGAAANKRERILDAAVRVFAERGFFHAKVAQIAQAAGVADGTIYLYFKSKDDLLMRLFEDRMERINQQLATALAEQPTAVERLRRAVALHLELVESHRHLAEVLTVELRQSEKFMRQHANPKFGDYLRLIARTVAEGQASGELRADLDPALVARALFGAIDELALAWLVRGKERMDLPGAARQVEHLFIDGLRASERANPRRRP